MSKSSKSPASSIISSLYIQALREGQSLWFRVASNSMFPLMQIEDSVYIQPATAYDIAPGEIAAFETSAGLVIHRIVYRQQTENSIRLLQMSDVDLFPSWVQEQAIVGKVVTIRRNKKKVDLRHPIAKWYGKIVADIRYRLYLNNKKTTMHLPLRGCSRISLRGGNWCLQRFCTSPVSTVEAAD
jgi:hypothetical protein